MNVLVVSARFPWPAYSGDRLRATVWLDALRSTNAVLVAPPGHAPAGIRFHPARRSFAYAVRGLVKTLTKGLPWQSLPSALYDWNGAIARATAAHGPFDATVIILARLDPWIDAPQGTRILDAIDSLARNMHERARAASPLMRWVWRAEERRTAIAERDMAERYEHLLFVSEEEAGTRGIAISNGVRIRPLDAKPRRYDFGFWGRLAYFANADAAQWLIDEIWPAIRKLRPNATLVIAGAAASPKIRQAAEHAGITLLSPVEDMPSLARDVRVAILPLRYGSGESTKMLEAAEAGCAVVATARGVRSLHALAAHARVAEDAQSLAREAVGLLDDTTSGAQLRTIAIERYSREATLARLASLVAVPALRRSTA
jgi:glycosyltransferase involved in cell wall biosynthesis